MNDILSIVAANPCSGNPCSHLCLLSKSKTTGYRCACPVGMTLSTEGNGKKCEKGIIYGIIMVEFPIFIPLYR